MRRNSASAAYFILALIGSLVLLSLSSQPQVGRVRSTAQAAILPVQAFLATTTRQIEAVTTSITEVGSLYSKEQRLRNEVQSLKDQIAELKAQGAENVTLKKELQFMQQAGYKTVAAEVVGTDPSGLVQAVTLDRGSSSGISKGMVVVSGLGLLGTVSSVSSDSANVILIDNSQSRVNATVVTSGLQGTVVGTGGGLTMQIFPEVGVSAKRGDYVMTSGIGGEYPRGLVIGQINQFQGGQQSVQDSAVIAPANDFQRLTTVLVILSFHPTLPAG